MKVNVLFCEHCPGRDGWPAKWIAERELVADDAPLPPSPWGRMTLEQEQAHIAAHQAEFDAWQAEQPVPDPPPVPVPMRQEIENLKVELAEAKARIEVLENP